VVHAVAAPRIKNHKVIAYRLFINNKQSDIAKFVKKIKIYLYLPKSLLRIKKIMYNKMV
jgi:hypothetical protein